MLSLLIDAIPAYRRYPSSVPDTITEESANFQSHLSTNTGIILNQKDTPLLLTNIIGSDYCVVCDKDVLRGNAGAHNRRALHAFAGSRLCHAVTAVLRSVPWSMPCKAK